MAGTSVSWEIIARDMASKAFLGVAASADEMRLQVTKAFAEQDAVARRSQAAIRASLKAQEAEYLKASAAAKKYGTSTVFLNSHKEQLDKVARGMAGFGAAAAVGFGAAVKQSADFNAEMARVGAFSDDAREHMGQLRELAMKVGVAMGYSGTQSAEAMEEMVKAGISAKDMINGGLKGALQLAAAGQIDVAQATEIASASMTQFGLSGKDIPHLADLLAAGADKALGGVGDLGEALKYAGTQAHQYGISIEDTTGVLAEFASQGQLGSMAGTTFAQMLARLGAPSMKAAKEIEKVGLNVYDVNGNFVDMTTLADRLSKAFNKLSPAERNASEQIIFGQRAIRGANILISEGAKHTQEWINKVNDQGFAAQTAGRKLDSLSGDLTKLKAAFDNALIGAGNSSQGALRSAVQGITGLINEWNKLPDAIKGDIAGITGGLAVLGLGGAATIKVIQGVAAMRKAMVDLGGATGPIKAFRELAAGADAAGVALTNAGRAARLAQVGIPLVGLAMIGVTTAIGHFQAQQAKEKQLAADFGQALDTITGKVNEQTIAMNKNVQQVAIKQLTDADAYKNARILGISYNEVTQAALGNADAQKRINDILEDVVKIGGSARTSIDGNTASMSDQIKAATDLGFTLDGTSRALSGQIEKTKEQKAATAAAAQAQKAASAVQKTWGDFVQEATKKQDDQRKQLEADRQAFIDAKNATLAASNSQIAFKQSIADATKAAKDNKHTLDLNTQAGRDNRTALNNLAGSTSQYIQDLIKNGASQKKLTEAVKEGRQAFIQTARQMGDTKAQAKKLWDEMGLAPKQVKIPVTAPGADGVARQIDQIITKIKDVHDKTVTVKYNVLTGESTARYSGGTNVASSKAGGGRIVGPGSGTSDDVPIMASNGEFMIKTSSAKKLGLNRLNYMNQTGEIPAFAGGGAIDRSLILKTIMTGASALGSALSAAQRAAISQATKAAKKAVPSFPGLSGGTSGGLQAYARALMAAHGWGDNNWPALKALWNGESGWNPAAYNAQSGATGIPQALPGSKMASAGPDWRTNGQTQIRWGEGYIASVYGSPNNAYAKWLARSPHWYAGGTNAALPGLAIVGENGPEAIVMRGGEQVIPHLAAGGPVKAAEFGSSTKYSVAAVVALIRAIQDPTRDLAKFTASVKGATLANKAAQAELRRPKSTLDRATRDYNRAVNQRNNLRLTNARQTNAARSRVATASAQVKAAELALDKMEPKSEKIRKAQSALVSAQKSLDSKRRSAAEAIAKIEDKIRNTKRGTTQYQNLLTEKSLKQKSNARAIAAAEDKVHAARKAAAKAGVNTDKIAAAQRRLTKAENELTRARAHQSKVSRDNALQTAEASAKVAKAEKAKKQATDAYNRASDRAKAKAQALKDAQQRLAEQQQAVADSAKQLSESFSDLYNQPTGTLTDLFKSMKQGTSDLTLFRKDLDRLRKMGLSESVIDQIVNQAQSGGVQSGITLANQAIGGGTYFINQLNKAAQQLKDASDILGYKTASAKGTGYASGTDWATPGIHDVSENKVEVVVGRQARRFMGGEMVKNLANLGRPAAPVMVAENQPSAELHIHFDRVTDVHSAAREFEDIMRKDTRWKGGVKIGLRTRGNQ